MVKDIGDKKRPNLSSTSLNLSPTHLVSNIRHRHTCGEMIFTVPVMFTSAVELQAILTVETSLDVDVQLLNP